MTFSQSPPKNVIAPPKANEISFISESMSIKGYAVKVDDNFDIFAASQKSKARSRLMKPVDQ